MSIALQRHNWTTGRRESKPVNERVLQEIVDILFMSTPLWVQDPIKWDRMVRKWHGEIETAEPIVPAPALTPTPAAPETWTEFLRAQRLAGKSMAEAGVAWQGRKVNTG